jgi:uridine kinase
VFDYRIDSEIDAPIEVAHPAAVLLFDGVFLQCSELYAQWDLIIWVDAPFEVTVERAIARDFSGKSEIERLRRLYERRYVPGQRIYMDRCEPQKRAHVVVDNSDYSDPRLEIRNV